MIEYTAKWIERATLDELKDAILEEPADSELFRGELGVFFWESFRARMEELYGRQTFGS